jgi:hypothetical protein
MSAVNVTLHFRAAVSEGQRSTRTPFKPFMGGGSFQVMWLDCVTIAAPTVVMKGVDSARLPATMPRCLATGTLTPYVSSCALIVTLVMRDIGYPTECQISVKLRCQR